MFMSRWLGRIAVIVGAAEIAMRSGTWAQARRPMAVDDLIAGAKRTVFESPDLSVDDFRFSPDGRSIWFTASENAMGNLYVVPTAGGMPKLVARGGSISEIQPGAGFVVFARSTLTAPPDLFRVSMDGG